ncbi:hypothetical protein KEJ47_08820 [Candidatus Bathyarchaeota archaeon]|nr:hypothetical protein [Candidatus Bathyarchaeota archaeon]
MRVSVSCVIHEVNVEVLIEGVGLQPAGACEILRTCLEEADAYLGRIMLEKDDEEAGQSGTPTSPGSAAATHPTSTYTEDPL